MVAVVGIAILASILIYLSFLFVDYLASKKIIPEVEEGKENMPIYSQSVMLFAFIAVSILLLSVYIYYIYADENVAFQSGIIFSLVTLGVGIIIQFIYMGINYITNNKYLYKLNKYEIKWTFILVCAGLAILCLAFNIKLLAYTFMVMILGKISWLDISKESFKDELDSFKNLTASYWYVAIFIIFLIVFYSQCKTITYFISSEIGILIGCILGIITIGIKHKE